MDKIENSLEEAASEYSFYNRPSIYGQVDVIDAFKAGAEWQKSQMLKDAVECEVVSAYKYIPTMAFLTTREKCPQVKDGDRAQIIIIPKED